MAVYKRGDTENKGKVTYNASIVKGIVILAVADVQGVAVKSGKNKLNATKITFNGDTVSVDIDVIVMYGYNVPDVAFNVQQSIKYNIESMSKYKVDSVNVHVSDVAPDESAK